MERLAYPVAEAAALVHRRKSWLYDQINQGLIATVMVGSQMMVPASEMAAYIERQAVAPQTRVQRLLDLVDDEGRIDVALLPDDVTLADLRAAKRVLAGDQG